MAVPLAAGYHGPPELTLARAFTSWTFDPWVCALALLLGACYLAGVRRARRGGLDWPAARTVAFAGVGLGTVVIATMSWTGAYAGVLFYARAAQTVLLLLLAPLFLVLGRPLSLAIAVAPGRSGQRLAAAIDSRAARLLTFPAITTVVLVVVPFLVYFTPWYTAFFHGAAIRELTYVALMVPGFVFFWTLIRVDPVPRAYPYLVSLWITGAEVIGDAILGIAVISDSRLLGGAYYHALARPWGPSPRFDQMLGGGTLWVLGDLVGLPFLAAQLIHMMREDATEAAAIDAELDARDAAAARASAVAAARAPAAAVARAPTSPGIAAMPAPGFEVPAAPGGEVPAVAGGEAPTAPGGEVLTVTGGEASAAPRSKALAVAGVEVPVAPGGEVLTVTGGEASAVPRGEVPAAPGSEVPAAPGSEATAAPRGEALAAPGGEVPAVAGTRPWWETDPRFTRRFGPADDQ